MNRGSTPFDISPYEAQCLLGAKTENASKASPSCSQEQVEDQEHAGNAWNESLQNNVPSAQIDRSQSEASLYAPPTRRSSIIQIPGVATRPAPKEPPILSKDRFRRSMPVTSKSGHKAVDSLERWRRSVPQHVASQSREFVVTPSDAEYKQLGVMKFGSLRIMNGTPISTSGGERESLDIVSATAQDEVNVEDKLSAFEASSSSESSKGLSFGGEGKNRAPEVQDVPGNLDLKTPGECDATDQSHSRSATFSRSDSGYMSNCGSISLGPSQKGGSTISRSGSGFISISSYKSGNDPSSQDESRYSSSISLRSLGGSKKEKRQAADRAVPDTEHQGLRPDYHVPFPPHANAVEIPVSSDVEVTPKTAENSTTAISRSNSFLSRGSALLTSFRGKKAKDSQPARSRSRSTPSEGALPTPTEASSKYGTSDRPRSASTSASASGVPKPNKIKRLLSTRRRSLPSDSNYIVADTTPMPLDAEIKLREHGADVSTESERLTLHIQQNKEILGTVPSTGSFRVKHPVPATSRETQQVSSMKSIHSKHSGLARAASFLAPKPAGHRRASLRKSISSVKGFSIGPDVEEEYDNGSAHLWGYELQIASIDNIRQGAGNSAFDQALVSMVSDYQPYAAMRRKPPPTPQRMTETGRQGQMQYPRLRSRRSAPDFLETVCEPASPGGLDSTQQKPPRTPPPVSLRTRGSKKNRRPRSRSQQQGFRPYPSQLPSMPSRLNMANPSNDMSYTQGPKQYHRRYPVHPFKRSSTYDGFYPAHTRPLFPGPPKTGADPRHQFQRQLSHGSGPLSPKQIRVHQPEKVHDGVFPYRPSHSHNLPVYRGVLIRSA